MAEATTTRTTASSLGARVVCGVDGSQEGLEAARQAARLVDPTGSLTLVASFNTGVAAQTGFLASQAAAELEREAQGALHDAVAAIGMRAETRLVDADPLPALREVARQLDATLVAIGTHEVSRALGILFSSVATGSVHAPTRATLIARDPHAAPERFPRSIAVGEDGSPASEHARSMASALAKRLKVHLRHVLCTEGDLDLAKVAETASDVEILHGKAQRELVRLSDEVDLLVVGATGRRGVSALGSVSERVAHRARCSVLIVPLPPTHEPD